MLLAPAAPAHAYEFWDEQDFGTHNAGELCRGDDQYGYGFTRRVVSCVRETVLGSVNLIMEDVFDFFRPILAVCVTLALAFWGWRVMTGRSPYVLRSGFPLVIKIGAVMLMFSVTGFNFTYLFGKLVDGMGELLGIVTDYVNFSPSFDGTCIFPNFSDDDPSMVVWDRVDCALDVLIGGLIPNSSVKLGIGGFLLAALLTNGPGIFIAMLGFLMIVQFAFAIARAVYIFIMSYLAFSVMAMIAPMMLPLILFEATKGYFEKWLRLSMGFLLQPAFLLVYLTMLLAAFDTVVYTGPYSLYNTITWNLYDEDATEFPPIGEWLEHDVGGLGLSAYTEGTHGDVAVNFDATNAGNLGCADEEEDPGAPCIEPEIAIDSEQTGVFDKVGEATTTVQQWQSIGTVAGITNIYESMGIADYFFPVEAPSTNVDWRTLACADPEAETCSFDGLEETIRYYIRVFLSAIMALATAYIFMLLLDVLPFIGTGVGELAGVIGGGSPGFGFGNLAPPGGGVIGGLRNKVLGAGG